MQTPETIWEITDRKIAHLREEVSRIQRQVHLIKEGKTHSGDKDRMDIVVDCCKEVDRVLCELPKQLPATDMFTINQVRKISRAALQSPFLPADEEMLNQWINQRK